MVTWYLPGCRLARGTDLLTVNWSELALLSPNAALVSDVSKIALLAVNCDFRQ